MTKLQAVVGLPSPWPNRVPYFPASDWMLNNGIGVYLPELRYRTGNNIAYDFNVNERKMNWNTNAITYTKRVDEPMVFTYGDYYYLKKPNTLRWEYALPSGQLKSLTQDGASLSQMVELLTWTREWFDKQGMPHAWIHVDEPPHAVRYGWTQSVEDRVVKFITASTLAGFNVRVSMAGHWQRNFWYDKLPKEVQWYMHTQTQFNKLNDPMNKPFGLYNKRNNYAGLSEQMIKEGAVRYLCYSAINPEDNNPILWENSAPTQNMYDMIGELEKVALHVPSDPPIDSEPPVEGCECKEQLDRMEKDIKTLMSHLGANT